MNRPSTLKTKAPVRKGRQAHYLLRLFVVGRRPNSKQALANLRQICEEYCKGCYTIETIDVTRNFAAAVKNNILITPALVLVSPLPRVVVLGNLSDRENLLLALRFPDGGK